MQNESMISIIVPVYKVERYLFQCIESIRAQTFTDYEVLCINDGSPDRSGEILGLYSRIDPRIKVIELANQGVSHARNVGIEAARGKYLCFVDSDDLLMPEMCNACVNAFEKEGLDIIKFSAEAFPKELSNSWIDSTISVGDCTFSGFSNRLIFDEHSRPYPWNGAYRTSFIKDKGIRFPEDLTLGEDQVFSFATLSRSRKTKLIHTPLYRYRLSRKDSLTSLASCDELSRLLEHQRVVRAILKDWRSCGLMVGESATRMLDFVYTFLLFDICEMADDSDRNLLLESFSQLLNDEFSRSEIERLASGPGVCKWLLRIFDYAGEFELFNNNAIYGVVRSIYGRKASLRRRCHDLIDGLGRQRVSPGVDKSNNFTADDGIEVDDVICRLKKELADLS